MGWLSKAFGSAVNFVTGDSEDFVSDTLDNATIAASAASGGGGGIGSLFGGSSILGPLIQGAGSYLGQSSANNANRDMAREQMGFQERMSSTAYQRAVQDMIKAGINPMLAASQGGASTPSGASARMEDAITPGLTTAMAARRANAEIDNLRETNDNIRANTRLAENSAEAALQQGFLNAANIRKADADTKLSNASAKNAEVNNRILQGDAAAADVKKAGYKAISPAVNSALDGVRNSGIFDDWLEKIYPSKRH